MTDFIKKNLNWLIVFTCAASVVVKNILLQGYIQDDNAYKLNIIGGLKLSLPYLWLYIAIIFGIFSFAFLFKGKGRGLFALILNGILSILVIADAVSARSFFAMPTLSILFLDSKSSAVGGAFSLLCLSDLFFILDFFLLIPLFIFGTKRQAFNKKENKNNIKLFSLIITGCVLIGGALPLCSSFFDNLKPIYQSVYKSTTGESQVLRLTSLGYHVIDIYQTTTRESVKPLTDSEQKLIDDYFEWKNRENSINEYFGQKKGKNLIFIQVESLENTVLNQKIDNQEITPYLNKLLNKSYFFNHVEEQVRMGNSSDCDLMVMAGVAPINSGSTFQLYPDRQYNSIAKIMAKSGYNSYYFHGAENAIWDYDLVMDGGIGFKNIKMNYRDGRMLNGYLDDKNMFEETLEDFAEVAKKNEPLYAHITTCTSHMPFDIPEEEQSLELSKSLQKNRFGSYLQAFHYVDKQIEGFVEGLDKLGLLDNTIIVIIGDHNGIHKYYPNALSQLKEADRPDWLEHQKLSSIPFIIYDKENTSQEEFDVVGGQIDIMPTVLYLMGVASDEYMNTTVGRNLFNTNRSFAYYPNLELIGTLSPEDQKIAKTVFDVSDLMIRGNRLSK